MRVVIPHVADRRDATTEPDALASIARAGAWFMASTAARGALGLATAIVIARHAGAEAFGRWTLAVAWASMITFALDLGFGVLLMRDAAADRASVPRLLASALAARALVFVPAAALFISAAPSVGLHHESVPALVTMLMLAGAGMAYGAIASVIRAWPERLPGLVALETAGALAQLAGTWHFVQRGGSVTALLAVAAAVQGAQFLVAALGIRRSLPPGNGSKLPSVGSILIEVRRASSFALAGMVANLQERLGPMLLGRMSGIDDVAAFGAAWRIGSAARVVPQAALGGALPVLARETMRGRRHAQDRFERTLAIVGCAAGGVLAAGAAPIVRVAYGHEFASAAATLAWVGAGLWPFVVNSARKVGLYAAGEERVAVRVSAITLIVQAAACLTLIPRFGAAGAAAAVALGEAAVWWPLRRYARARS